MNNREQYLASLTFGSPDKIPFQPGAPRRSTLKRWHGEGLPEGANWFGELQRAIGIRVPEPSRQGNPQCVTRMNPMFEEKVLEHKNGH